MNVTYEQRKNNYSKYTKLDNSKKNILILGPASNENERKNIINPMNTDNAYSLYGKSKLYNSYLEAYSITNDSNIYTCNCYTLSDYLELAKNISQYDFDYIVPIGIYLSDKYYNPYTQQDEYYTNYFLNFLKESNSLSILIMTDKHGSLYEDSDFYLKEMRIKQNKYLNTYLTNQVLKQYGNHLIFVLNMLKNIEYANAVFGAILASSDDYNYPANTNLFPEYTFDKNDMTRLNYVYFKYNYLTNNTSVENLLNFNINEDIYKNILINEIIKKVIKIVDLNEYKGKLYNNYIKLQISTKISSILKPYVKKLFKDFKIENIGFVKTTPGCGYIYVEISIIPFGLIEKINLVMEV